MQIRVKLLSYSEYGSGTIYAGRRSRNSSFSYSGVVCSGGNLSRGHNIIEIMFIWCENVLFNIIFPLLVILMASFYVESLTSLLKGIFRQPTYLNSVVHMDLLTCRFSSVFRRTFCLIVFPVSFLIGDHFLYSSLKHFSNVLSYLQSRISIVQLKRIFPVKKCHSGYINVPILFKASVLEEVAYLILL